LRQTNPPGLGVFYISISPALCRRSSAQASLRINAHLLISDLEIQPSGGFVLFLDTSQADPGEYVVAIPGFPAAVSFVLDENAPLRPKEGDGEAWMLPSGIVLDRALFLPMIGATSF